jgi:UDP-perosamine 4-acetyltransferase
MKDVVLIGGGGHAKSVLDALSDDWLDRLAGYVAPESGLIAGVTLFYLGTDAEAARLVAAGCDVVIAGVGGARSNTARQAVFELWKAAGAQFAFVCHATAVVSRTAVIGEGTVCLAQSTVGPGATIGANVIVNTSASVDHDCTIGAHVHIAPGATLCGSVQVGDGAFVGAGATIVPGVSIGAGATVAAGSTVVADVAAGQIVWGLPARPRPVGKARG